MKVRTTIRDLARALGVSHTTVSMALRQDPRIPAETRRRVVSAAKRLGYRRDPVISELMAQLKASRRRSGTEPLGFLTAWPTESGWRSAYNHVRFFEGAAGRAHELGYRLDEFWLREPGMTPRRMTSILRARGIRGVLVFSLAEPEGRVALDWRYFASVTKGLTVVHPVMHRVISSHYDDMRLVLKKLRQHGYRRLGLVLGDALSKRVGHAWLAGFYMHRRETPADLWVPELIVSPGTNEAPFAEWFSRHRPEVVLFAEQPLLDWCARLHINVPLAVGLVDLAWSRHDPDLAGIDSDPDNLGVAAVDLLAGQLQAHEYGVPSRAKIVEVLGKWVPGKSLR